MKQVDRVSVRFDLDFGDISAAFPGIGAESTCD